MPTIVQTFHGRVTGLWGTAHMRGADGKMHLLKLGDLVQKGDVILTTQNGIVQLDADATAPLPTSVAKANAGNTNAPDEIDRVISALNDPSAQDATAAGVSGGDGAGDLAPGLRVDRISEGVTPAGLPSSGADDGLAQRPVTAGTVIPNEVVQQPALGAASNIIDASEEGAAVGLGLTAPTNASSAAVITVTQVPVIGQLQKADGTVVAAGSVISASDLVGLKYVPPADYNGSAPVGEFSYTVTDAGHSANGTVGIVLAAVNDAPVATADTASGLENTPITGNVLTNDSDVDGPALQVTQYTIAGVVHAAGTTTALVGIGSIAVNTDGSYTFTPAADYNGQVPVIGYTVSDGSLTSSSTLTLSVTAVNHAPTAASDLASTPINVAVTIPVLANDHDRDGDTLTVTTATLADPTQGSVTINPDGSLGFTPANNYTGTATITYTVSDGHGGTDTATVTVNVGSNTPPTGTDSTHTLVEDGSYTVATSDFGFADADAGQTLANVRIDTLPSAGTLLLNGVAVAAGVVVSVADIAAGHLVFVPAADGSGAPYAGITFSVQDSAGGYDTTSNTLTLNVTPVNDAPVAVSDTGSGLEDTPQSGNVLSNDSDIDGNALSVTQFVVGGTTYAAGATATLAGVGTLSIDADGSYHFTPAANYNGPVPVATYTVTDGSVTQDATLTLAVTAVNDAPVAVDDLASTPINTPVVVSVLANDTDVDGDTLTVSSAVLTNPALGSVVVNADGTLGFTPANNVTGPVSISYTVSDGHGGSTVATVTVNVGSNTPPTGADSAHTLVEDGSYTVAASDFGFADTDAGQTLAGVRIDTLPAAGSLLLNGVAVAAGAVVSAAEIAAGHLVFVPVADGNGAPYTSFSFSVQDSAGAFDAAPNTLTLNVTPQPDAAVITGNASGATVEDTTLVASGKLDVTDPDAGEAAFVVQSGSAGAHGSFSIDAAGHWTYTLNNADPAVQALGAGQTLPSEVFAVKSIDGTTVNVTVSITGTDDAPVISTGSGAVTENTTPSTSGTLTASDVDNPALAFVPATLSGSYGSLVLQSNGQWTYTLDARAEPLAQGQTVSEPITVTLTDGSTTTVTITVTGTNDAAVITGPVTGSVTEDGTLATGGHLVASDVDSAATFTPQTLTLTYGNFVIDASGNWSYTLRNGDANVQALTSAQHPTETVSITTADGTTQQITVTVNGANETPTATATPASGAEDAAGIPIALHGADADGTVASFTVSTLPLNGTLFFAGHPVVTGEVIPASGNGASLSFVPDANWNGSTSLVFSATDNEGATSAPVSQPITVTAVNDAPTLGVPGAQSTAEDTSHAITGVTVADVDGDALTTTLTVAHGTLSVAASGATLATGPGTLTLTGTAAQINTALAGLSYAPDADYNGSDTLTVSTSDGTAPAVNGSVPITVTAVADIVADSVSTPEDTTLVFNPITGTNGASADNFEGTPVISGIGAPLHGTATFNAATGQITYTPTGNYNGADSFTYTVTSGGVTETATISVNVTPVNDAPTLVVPGAQTTNEDTAKAIAGVTVADVDGDTLTTTISVAHGALNVAAGATLSGNGTGTVTLTGTAAQINASLAGLSYNPSADYNGTDTLNVSTSDGVAAPVTGSVAITVAAVADIVNDTVNATEDTVIAFNPITGANEVSGADNFENAGRTLTAVGTPGHGTVTFAADGTITYTPAANYNGPDSFTYTVTSNGTTETATISVNVAAVNDAPVVAVPGAQSTSEDTNKVITGVSVADVDSNALTTTLTVAHGTLSVVTGSGATITSNGSGTVTLSGTAAQINTALASITYKPTADFNGADTLNVATFDGAATTNAAVAIAISAVPDIVADVVAGTEDVAVTFNPITGANEVSGADNFENAGRTLTAVGTPAHGTATFAADGTITYTPNANYNGSDSFSYTVSSGGVTETATITINLTPVNDATVPTLTVTPVARWTFDETSGTTTKDAYNAQNGTLTDSVPTPAAVLPTWTTGHNGTSGTALHFDGTGSYVALSTTTTAPLMGTSSLTFWIKTSQTGNFDGWDSPAVIASEQAGGTNDIQWGVLNGSGKIGFDVGNAAGVYSTTSVNDNTWHQVAITRDAATSLVSIYVDGVLEATGSPTDAGFTATLNKLAGFGATNNFNNDAAGTDATDYRFLNADLDDVRIYNHVLTADQVAAIKSVESGYSDTAVANDGDAIKLSLAADHYTSLSVHGLNTGMVISDGAGHTTTIGASGTDTVVDLTGWNLTSLSVSGSGTGSSTLVFDAIDTVAGESHATTQYLNIVNGTSLLSGGTGNDTLNGTGNADLIVGNAGNDTISGGAGNDRLLGGAGNDTINGGSGNDIIYGGAGNDVMTGGTGADTFAWHLADRGTAGAPAADAITDFNVAPVASGGDTLDLRDLLVGANHVGTDPGNLEKYLDFDTTSTPGSTVIHVSSTGGYAGGNYAAATTDETITLQGVDLRSALGLGTAATDSQIITELLTRNKLVTDGA